MASLSYEDRVVLALEAVQKSKNISIRAAAELYNVQRATLQNRRDGKPARRDTSANSKKLTQSEEEAIVQYVIELSARAFPPRLCGVEDMANQLLRERDAPPVGKLWAHRFVKRQPEIRTRYTRRYDYQRAKCEDPKIIGEWFALVQNTKAKYGILDEDIHNFDETGFVMGMIFPGLVLYHLIRRGSFPSSMFSSVHQRLQTHSPALPVLGSPRRHTMLKKPTCSQSLSRLALPIIKKAPRRQC